MSRRRGSDDRRQRPGIVGWLIILMPVVFAAGYVSPWFSPDSMPSKWWARDGYLETTWGRALFAVLSLAVAMLFYVILTRPTDRNVKRDS